MDLELHAKAITAFNGKAQKINEQVRLYQVIPRSREKTITLDSEPFVSVELTEENTDGPRFITNNNDDGLVTNASLTVNDKMFELQEEGCGLLVELTESIWRAGNTAFVVNKEFIFRNFFDWVVHVKSADDKEFIGYLNNSIESKVEIHTVLIPLFHLRSSFTFKLLDCVIREVSGEEIDRWFPGEGSEDHVKNIKAVFQGYCVIEANIHAIEDHAVAEALRLAGIISSLLAFYSLASVRPQALFNGVPVGQECAPKYSALVFNSSGPKPTEVYGYINPEDMLGYELTKEKIEIMDRHGIKEMSELFRRGRKTDFQSRLRDSVSTFARASLTKSTSEKLVFGVVAMESLFVGNDSGSICQNLADRLALLLGESVEERKKYASTVKKAYGLRSRYVHHGKSSEDNKIISDFLMLAYLALINALLKSKEIDTKLEFLNSLDDLKYEN